MVFNCTGLIRDNIIVVFDCTGLIQDNDKASSSIEPEI